MKISARELEDLVRTKIENLRPKLLDLSRRNPLIAAKLGPRSSSHIRVVDELPDVLFFGLSNEQEMELIPLPPIEEDPRDEQTREFRETLINAQLTDEFYIKDMESVARDADDYLDKSRAIERALKDKIRTQIGLPPRVQKTEPNLVQHAKNNGISPSYELPEPNDEHNDGRHSDGNIQTLLLPSDLERKLNSIGSKSRTWIQETGLNVLHVAIGFLEWSEDDQSDSSFAPLVLLPVELRKKTTPHGARFSIASTGDEYELNAVLMEKLRIDFAVELPDFDGNSIEAYLSQISSALPKKKRWRVRRQAAVGVFPSARMAMYHDLDTTQTSFPKSEIIQALLAGNNSAGASPFADEYDVDDPDIERKVPCLITEADSSQFSALADIADGNNLAIEGPPGTGKSQTIVNAIAGALGAGKKVLFVAEKLAALNVVKSRLEAAGLGEFLLPLQAEKSTREQVIQSIRGRLEIRDARTARDYGERLKEFQRIRNALADYIDLITSEFEGSGLSVHAILGKSIATSDRLSELSSDTIQQCSFRSDSLNRSGLSQLLQFGQHIEAAHQETLGAKACWKGSRLVHPERFTIEEACDLAHRASQETEALERARDALTRWGIDKPTPCASLDNLASWLAETAELMKDYSKDFLSRILLEGNADALSKFLDRCSKLAEIHGTLGRELTAPADRHTLEKLRAIDRACSQATLPTVKISELEAILEAKQRTASAAQSLSEALQPLVTAYKAASTWFLNDLAKAYSIYRKAGRDVISLRNEKLAEENAAYHLLKLCQEGQHLVRDRGTLSARLTISTDIPIDTLVQCCTTLRSAGALSFLSSSYRSAKRLYRSISPFSTYSKFDAVKNLDDLIAFRRKVEEYLKRAENGGLFGIYYRGLDTKFEPFEALAKYYQSVSEEFGGPERLSLRSFLRDSPISDLDLIPKIPSIRVEITFDSLGNYTTEANKEVEQLDAALSQLRPIVHILKEPRTEPNAVSNLIVRLESSIENSDALDQDAIARDILGEEFAGHQTSAERFQRALNWAHMASPFQVMANAVFACGEPEVARGIIHDVVVAEEKRDETLSRLGDIAQIETKTFVQDKSLAETAAVLQQASEDKDGLFKFAAFATAVKDAEPYGLVPLLDERLRSGSLLGFGGQVEALAVRQLAKSVYKKLGSKLSKYRGTKLDELRRSLAEKDKEIIQLSRRQLRAKVKNGAHPPSGNGIGRKSTWTDMALIENEISKKQRFIAVRDLTQRAGKALIELKPCWMMSPLAVAQYLPKGALHFDLCIVDEASQMPPESAIGALLRCDQVVVVGDTNQLPPSNFFKTVIDDEEEDEDEAVLNESILEMANGAFRPARRLRWHYRSRHSGLIKFSNRLIYDDNLIVFPSPTEALARMGVEYRGIKGRYKSGTNPEEAQAIVEAIIEFMRTDPDRSLGVVTLNQKQRDLITQEFEYAIANERTVQRYIETWQEKNDGLEEFFIKNLENVQGDERDVIFIGTVYGAEEPGARVMQRFGPINGLAGKRRLNVLFTRAKQKIVTFSSMTAADIEAEAHTNPGTYMLKRWLEYSATGLLDAGIETEREPDSDFEIFVMDQIRAMGCTPVPQVGVAGYFVDIGIKHPEWPHGYLLGVECDGATYHSAKSARDRDRLRQEVLENLGWRLHRIWSTDWFNSPSQEVERLRKVITTQLSELKAREHEYVPSKRSLPTSDEESPPAKVDIEGPLTADQSIESQPAINQTAINVKNRVEVGDTVRVRYLTDDKRTMKITISDGQSDLSKGMVHYKTPMAAALLGAEEGDEIEVLVGSYIRPAVVERLVKRSD